MLSEKMKKGLNDQINAEIYSAYLYLSMASYFDSENLKGFANWMKVQAQEEMTHAMKFYSYLYDKFCKVDLKPLDGPPVKWNSSKAVFEESFKHEQKVTALINSLVDLARSEKDHATENFLQWFVAEQVEEEASADEVLNKLKMIGDSGPALMMLDHELGARKFGG